MNNKISEFLEVVSELNPGALYPTGFEDAIVGYIERCGESAKIVLDRHKCIEIIMERDGMNELEAEEFMEFNVIGSYVGEDTPYFITTVDNVVK